MRKKNGYTVPNNDLVAQMLLQVALNPRGADGVEFALIIEDALGEGHVPLIIVRRDFGMQGLDLFGEASAIVDKLPAAGKPLNTAERLKVHDVRMKQLVGRFCAEGEIELRRLADDPRARQSLEPVDLDLWRVAGFHDGIESLGKGRFILTW